MASCLAGRRAYSFAVIRDACRERYLPSHYNVARSILGAASFVHTGFRYRPARRKGTPITRQHDNPRHMARKSPWHSVKSDVYHNNTNCNTGNNIERENLRQGTRSEEHTSELQSLMRISYAVFCLKKKNKK